VCSSDLILGAVEKFFGDISISKLSEEKVYEFINTRREKVNPTTLRNDLVSLKALLNFCKKILRIINYHPFDIIPIKQVSLNPEFLSTNDINKLFHWNTENPERKWLKFFIQLALVTGFRRGELSTLKWQDVDLHKKIMTVNGKTGIRKFPLSFAAKKILSKHQSSALLVNNIEYKDDMYLFHKHLSPYTKYDANTLTHYVKDVFRECNLSEKYTLHSLRHTFGAHYYKNTRNLEKLQKLMGHSNISTTQIYAHVTIDTEDVDGKLSYADFDSPFTKSLKDEIGRAHV